MLISSAARLKRHNRSNTLEILDQITQPCRCLSYICCLGLKLFWLGISVSHLYSQEDKHMPSRSKSFVTSSVRSVTAALAIPVHLIKGFLTL